MSALRLTPRALTWAGGCLSADRPAVMAILNVTPDSFFDGGRYAALDDAVARAWAVAEHADVLDVGGESTRPGADPVSEAEELARVVPLIAALAAADYPRPISIDTTRAAVAAGALEAGACIVNDVTGGRREPALLTAAADAGAAVVLMHMRGTPRTMQRDVRYADLLRDVRDHLAERCAAATAAGVPAERQCVDPGIGFGKSPQGNLDLLGNLGAFESLERPVLVGASRKSFLGALFGQHEDARREGSLAVAAVAGFTGASVLRVHDVAETRRVVDVAAGLAAAGR